MGRGRVRVLVAEDSAVTRDLLRALLDDDPGLEVVGIAHHGEEVVVLAERLRPDVILMDIHMPRLGGHEASRLIMERVPTPIVVMTTSSSATSDGDAFEALQAGALLVVEKPRLALGREGGEVTDTLRQTLKLMAEVKVVRRRAAPPPAPPRTRGGVGLVTGRAVGLQAERRSLVRVVAIGASTGGPPVVQDILGALPTDLGCPVLVVQHIADGFAAGFAAWLAHTTPFQVEMAEDGATARAGGIYLAPPGAHLGIRSDGRMRLSREPERDGFRPSISSLLESVAQAFGAAAIGVVLTGMGRDGASGLLRLRETGGITVAQDEQSSAIFGMPREAIRLDAAAHVLPPTGIAELIRASVPRRAP